MKDFRSGAAGLFLCVLAPATAVADGVGFLDLLYVPKLELEVDVSDPVLGNSTVEGKSDGYGARTLIRAGERFALTGEYLKLEPDDSSTGSEAELMRAGIGVIGPSTSGAFVEWNDNDGMDGFALHGRLAGGERRFLTYIDGGYAQLEDDNGIEFKGPEISAGFAAAIKDTGALVVDYRITKLEGSDSGTDVEITTKTLRAGIRLGFGR